MITKKRDSNKLKLILFGILVLFVLLDAWVITPYGLSSANMEEANPLHAWGQDKFGMAYFYFSPPIYLFAFLLLINLYDRIQPNKKYVKIATYGWLSLAITASIAVNIHNLNLIFNLI